MPQIIPIRDLKNTSEISALCNQTNEPVFVTKNGYGDLVIMSVETYEKNILLQDAYQKLTQAQLEVASNQTIPAKDVLHRARKKYDL